MDILSALLGGLILLFILNTIKKGLFSKKYKLPPGPFPWPVFGNSFQLDYTGPHKTFTKWGDIYGGIFKIKVFQETVVVVNDARLIQEVLIERSAEFAGRPRVERVKMFLGDQPDIAFTSISPDWQVKKKMLLQGMRKYGDIAGALEQISYKAIDKMLKKIQQYQSEEDGVFDLRPLIHHCTAEIICSVAYGENYTDEDLKELLEMEVPTMKMIAPLSPHAYIDFIPFSKYLPTKHVQELSEMADINHNFFNKKLREMKSITGTDEPLCIFEGFIQYQRNGENLTDLEIANIMFDTVYAGFTTTTITLHAFMGILLNRPEIQEKIHQEICTVIGKHRPCLADRSKMPYTEACILEIGRYASILPTMLPHATVKDTNLGGFDIPAGTTILPNVWGLHHDERHWKDPFAFSPERFLEADGTLVGPDHPNRKILLPFGAGRRVCAGEVLARNRMFLILTSLIQKYKYTEETPGMPPKCDPREYSLGIVMFPPEYKVRIQER